MTSETLIFFSIAVGIACGLIVSGIAESKGRVNSKFGFFLFGFFFSIIALIFVLIMEKQEVNSSNTENLANSNSRMKFCTECGVKIEISSKFCPECGTKVKTV